MQPGELLQRRGGHDHFPAVVEVRAFGAGHHYDGVAAEVFVEAAVDTGWALAHAVWRGEHLNFVVEIGLELCRCELGNRPEIKEAENGMLPFSAVVMMGIDVNSILLRRDVV